MPGACTVLDEGGASGEAIAAGRNAAGLDAVFTVLCAGLHTIKLIEKAARPNMNQLPLLFQNCSVLKSSNTLPVAFPCRAISWRRYRNRSTGSSIWAARRSIRVWRHCTSTTCSLSSNS